MRLAGFLHDEPDAILAEIVRQDMVGLGRLTKAVQCGSLAGLEQIADSLT